MGCPAFASVHEAEARRPNLGYIRNRTSVNGDGPVEWSGYAFKCGVRCPLRLIWLEEVKMKATLLIILPAATCAAKDGELS